MTGKLWPNYWQVQEFSWQRNWVSILVVISRCPKNTQWRNYFIFTGVCNIVLMILRCLYIMSGLTFSFHRESETDTREVGRIYSSIKQGEVKDFITENMEHFCDFISIMILQYNCQNRLSHFFQLNLWIIIGLLFVYFK